MADSKSLTDSLGCLAVEFPQFVAKELATLVDEVTAAVASVVDPLATIGDISLQGIVDGVATLSQGSIWNNVAEASAGLAASYAQREVSDIIDSSATLTSVAKGVQRTIDLSEKVVTAGMLMASLFPDMPYAAAQRLSDTLVRLIDLKVENLNCLSKHVTQLTNGILLLVNNPSAFRDGTFGDLGAISAKLDEVERDLGKSRRSVAGAFKFDPNAFQRARDGLQVVDNLLTPATGPGDVSILSVTEVLVGGSLNGAHKTEANMKLTRLVIPQLLYILEVEAAAIKTQVETINFYVTMFVSAIQNFRSSANASRVQEFRSRLIAQIILRVQDLHAQVDDALLRQQLREASFQMMAWASRVKSILSMMDQVKDVTRQEGSIDGPDHALVLDNAYQAAVEQVGATNTAHATNGIESVADIYTKTMALTSGARRILKQIEDNRVTKDELANFHALAAQIAINQISLVAESQQVAGSLRAAFAQYSRVGINFAQKFQTLTGAMSHLGLDRAVDLLETAQFTEFMSADIDVLSYVGVAIRCLTNAIKATDDVQTRRQIERVRNQLVGRKTNQQIASSDTADGGRLRGLLATKDKIAEVQQNAETIKSILEYLKGVASQIGIDVTAAIGASSALLPNIDHLAVGAGGRLSADLDSLSDQTRAGVPLC